MLEVGKLYRSRDYFLLLFSDKKAAARARCGQTASSELLVPGTAYWSNRFGKAVGYAKKNIPLLVLNVKGKYIEVLAGDKKGWIINEDFLYLKEIR